MKPSLKTHYAFLGAATLYTLAPIIAVIGSLGLAKIANCENLNEGSQPDCAIESLEGIIYTGFVSGWFGLITLPTGGPVALILLASLPIHYLVLWKKGQSKPE